MGENREIRLEAEPISEGGEAKELHAMAAAVCAAMPENLPELRRAARLDVSRDPAMHYLGGLSEGSHTTQHHGLNAVARLLVGDPEAVWPLVAWEDVRFIHANAFRALLQKKVAGHDLALSTANRYLTTLKSVLERAWHIGLCTRDDLDHIRAAAKAIPGSIVPPGRLIPDDERDRMLALCDGDTLTPRGLRNGGLLALLFACGLRRAEASDLTLAEFDAHAPQLQVKVTGKGNRERVIPVAAESTEWPRVLAWRSLLANESENKYVTRDWANAKDEANAQKVCYMPDTAPLQPHTPYFRPIRPKGEIVTSQLQGRDIARIVTKFVTLLGLPPTTPHDFRRTFASSLLRAGIDVFTVQKLMGHASSVTTGRYDRRGEEENRAAVEQLAKWQKKQKEPQP